MSRHVINLNGNVNVIVTFWLFKFVNISIKMGPNENWWRRKYASKCAYIYIYIYVCVCVCVCVWVCVYITNHLLAYEMWSLAVNITINVLNLISLNNTIHINIHRYVLYQSKYCSSTVMSYTCTIYILTMLYTAVCHMFLPLFWLSLMMAQLSRNMYESM